MSTLKKRLLLLLTAPLLVILALECVPLRFLFPVDPRGAAREFCAAGMFVSIDDELRHFALTPGISVTVGARQYRHNQRGLRGPEVLVPKPAGVERIAVVGDSYTYGWGVAEDDSIPAQLAERLKARAGAGRTIEVVNAGVPAYDTGPELALLRDVVLPLGPDRVVLVFQTNDITTVDQFYLDDQKAFYACDLPIPYRLKHVLRHSSLYHLARRTYTALKTRSGFEWFGAREWPRTRGYLEQFVALCQAAHVDLTIVNLPHFQGAGRRAAADGAPSLGGDGSSYDFLGRGTPNFSYQSAWIDAFAREHGVPCVDILPLIQARVRQAEKEGNAALSVEMLYVDPVNDHHLNAAGCGLVAQALAEELQS